MAVAVAAIVTATEEIEWLAVAVAVTTEEIEWSAVAVAVTVTVTAIVIVTATATATEEIQWLAVAVIVTATEKFEWLTGDVAVNVVAIEVIEWLAAAVTVVAAIVTAIEEIEWLAVSEKLTKPPLAWLLLHLNYFGGVSSSSVLELPTSRNHPHHHNFRHQLDTRLPCQNYHC